MIQNLIAFDLARILWNIISKEYILLILFLWLYSVFYLSLLSSCELPPLIHHFLLFVFHHPRRRSDGGQISLSDSQKSEGLSCQFAEGGAPPLLCCYRLIVETWHVLKTLRLHSWEPLIVCTCFPFPTGSSLCTFGFLCQTGTVSTSPRWTGLEFMNRRNKMLHKYLQF